MSHAESLPVLFINHDLQQVNKHTNKSLEENKTQSSLTTLSHAHCAPSAARVQHQQERHRIQQEHFNREGNIAYFQHVATTPPPEITITGRGTGWRMTAIFDQLELMRTRHSARHSSSQRSVLRGMAAMTIQRS